MNELLEMKQQIYWQEQNLNIHSACLQHLNWSCQEGGQQLVEQKS
jgi:hypothetical protein